MSAPLPITGDEEEVHVNVNDVARKLNIPAHIINRKISFSASRTHEVYPNEDQRPEVVGSFKLRSSTLEATTAGPGMSAPLMQAAARIGIKPHSVQKTFSLQRRVSEGVTGSVLDTAEPGGYYAVPDDSKLVKPSSALERVGLISKDEEEEHSNDEGESYISLRRTGDNAITMTMRQPQEEEHSGHGHGHGGTVNEHDTHAAALADRRKHVHFPEDVVKSVEVIPRKNRVLFRVEYSRPMLAYIWVLITLILYPVGWSQTCRSAWSNSLSNWDVARGVATIGFFSYSLIFATYVFWGFVTHTPGHVERAGFWIRHKMSKLMVNVVFGSLAQFALYSSFIIDASAVNFIIFSIWPLVFSYIWYVLKYRRRSMYDVMGVLLCLGGSVVFFIGEGIRSSGVHESTKRRVASSMCALCGAFLEGIRWTYEKQARRYFTNTTCCWMTYLTLSILSLCMTLGLHGFTKPIGPRDGALSHLDNFEVRSIIGACVCLCVAVFSQHASAMYFDNLTGVATMALCGPLLAVFWPWFNLPSVSVGIRAAAASMSGVGAAILMVTGGIGRRRVEVVVHLPGSHSDSDSDDVL